MIKKNKNDMNGYLEPIEQILSSGVIKDNEKLRRVFLSAKESIEKGERDALARLSNDISWYLVTNKYQAPKEIIDFARQIAKEPSKERGKLAFLQMLALSLIKP